MKIRKIITLSVLIITFFTLYNVHAVESAGLLDDVFNGGNNFFKPSDSSNISIGEDVSKYIKTEFIPIITLIGNLIIVSAGIFLGVKYIWSGVAEKSQIKQSLMTFCVAAIFFYSAQTVFNFFTGIITGITANGNAGYETVLGNIWTTVLFVLRLLAFAGMIAVGLKYMLTSADGKADIKSRMIPVVVGILLVFLCTEFINFILGITTDTLM